jgi:hypothetical protein
MRRCVLCAIPGLLALNSCGTVPEESVSGSGNPDSGSAKLEEHSRMAEAITPFMYVEYATQLPTVIFDKDAARAAGLGDEVIQFGIEGAEFANWVPGEAETPGDPAAKHAEPAPWAREAEWYAWFRQMADPCGSWTNARRYGPFRDRPATEAALRAAGYHRTWLPGQAYDDRDWTRAVQYAGVPMSTGHAPTRAGAYRYHARVASDWRSYTVQGTPTPEPNPEVHSYFWPSWWWYRYSWWYHQVSGC